MIGRSWSHRRAAFALCATIGAAAPCQAAPLRGAAAPAISLTSLDGEMVSTARLAPRSLVLIFGELDHDGARQACADVLDALADPRVKNESIAPILIIARDAPPAQLKVAAATGRFPSIILHDPKREAFAAYDIVAAPTVVVVNGAGTVIHSMPGYLHGSKEILIDVMLAATGKESPEQLGRALNPSGPAASQDAVRADRLVHLGLELGRHGQYEAAEARYMEALAAVPGHTGATLALGELMLRRDRPADAEALFGGVLALHPDSMDAELGIAAAQVQRGGEERIQTAEATIKAILENDRAQPRAHYLMGRILEMRGDLSGAAAQYRQAVELFLNR